MEPRQVLSVDEIDLSSAEFWSRPIEERDGAFLTLREQRPVSFHEEPAVKHAVLPPGLRRSEDDAAPGLESQGKGPDARGLHLLGAALAVH